MLDAKTHVKKNTVDDLKKGGKTLKKNIVQYAECFMFTSTKLNKKKQSGKRRQKLLFYTKISGKLN